MVDLLLGGNFCLLLKFYKYTEPGVSLYTVLYIIYNMHIYIYEKYS